MKHSFFFQIATLSCIAALLVSACKPKVVNPIDDGILKGSLTENLTLTDRVAGAGVDYTVQGEYSIEGATLTVAPSVTIQFEQDASMLMIDMGALNAVGTAAQPIIFTGKQATKGFWKGLFFINSDNIKNELTYCTIEYGGSNADYYQEGNVVLGDNLNGRARLSMQHTTIRNSASMGMYVSSESFLDIFTNCTITGNDNAPVQIESDNSDVLDSSNDYSGNTENYILVEGDTYEGKPILRNMTWDKLNVPYGINNNIVVEKTLTIAAGTVIHGLNNSGFYINGQDTKIGKLQINGTASDPVMMDGEQATAGYWKGIILWCGDADISYCTINHAGQSQVSGGTERAAVIADSYYEHVSNLIMTNCTISNSAHYGVAVDSVPDAGSGGVGSIFTNNGVVFNGCVDGDIFVY